MKKKAFTLVEIMAVVALIAVLFMIFIPRIGFAANKTKVVGVQTDFRSYETAMQSVGVESSSLSSITKAQSTTPEKSAALVAKLNGYLDPALQIKADKFGVLSTEKKDPWGTPYTVGYSEADDALYLYSFGADKKPGKDYKHVPTEAVGDDLVLVQKDNTLYSYGFPVNSKNDNKPNSPVLMTGLTITKAPTKLVYQIGENFDPTGMEVKASYSNGTEGVITDYIVTDGTKMAAGKSVVTISYTEEGVTKTALQSIEVKNPLVFIKIGTEPTKKNYIVGENFDPAGMVVVATYTDESSVPVSGYTVTGGNALTDQSTSVIVSYTEDGITKTVSQAIIVTNPLVSIAITKAPTKTEYIAGTNFDPAGMVITATYTNKETKAVSGTVTDGNNLAVGKQNVTISHTEGGVTKTVLQAITVTNPLVSIAITKAPNKTVYVPGNNFDPTGMEITATYTNKETKAVSGTVTDGNNLAVGKQNVTISYTEGAITKTATQTINIEINETVFTFSDGTTQTVDVVGPLIKSNYAVPSGAALTGVKIGKHVTTIGNYAFSHCASLTSVTIPNSVTTIGDGAFSHCASLTSVTIPSSVTTIRQQAFYKCTSLTSVTIPNGVTTIGDSAFQECTSLTSVTIQNGVTTIERSAFFSCTSLTSVTIPSSVTTIGGHAFASCTSLSSVTIPNSVTTIGDWTFYNCESLTSVTIPSSVTTIEGYAFGDCSSLTSVNIPSSVTTIGEHAFDCCFSLTSVTIPSSVTTIGDCAFRGCSSLTSVNIPNSVTTIGGYAFEDCTSLTSITIPNSVTTIGWLAFSKVKHIIYNGTATGTPWGALEVTKT